MNGATVIQPAPIPFLYSSGTLSWNYGIYWLVRRDVRRIILAISLY